MSAPLNSTYRRRSWGRCCLPSGRREASGRGRGQGSPARGRTAWSCTNQRRVLRSRDQLSTNHSSPAGGLHVVRVMLGVPQLGGDEDVGPWHAACSDARANLLRRLFVIETQLEQVNWIRLLLNALDRLQLCNRESLFMVCGGGICREINLGCN